MIRIDPPGGLRWPDPAFEMISRGKLALTLDLKRDEIRETVIELVRRADVFDRELPSRRYG